MEYYSIEECCEILDSKRVPITGKDRIAGPYPYYGANGIQDYVAEYIFDEELVLVAEDGGHFGSKDKPIAYRVSGKCWVNNHAHVLRTKNMIDIDYLCYSLMFYNVGNIVNGATRQKLNQKQLRQMTIPKIPLDAQKKIVQKLSNIATIKENRKQQIDLYDDLIKSRFVEMFGDPVHNLKGWELKPLSDCGDCKNGMNFAANETGVELKYLGVGDFKNITTINEVCKLGNISLNKMPKDDYLLNDGDVVFVRSNGNKRLVGRCLAVYPNGVPTTFSGFCIRFRNTDPLIEIPYLLQVLKMDSMRLNMAGRGANIQNLNQQILSNLKIPIPPNELQLQFTEFINQVDKLKVGVQKSLDESQILFDSLMQKYFD